MKLSKAGAGLIEQFEGFRAHPYRDAVGVWTIGYGSTRNVGPNTPSVTPAQAEQRMMREVDATYGAAVNALGVPLTQAQFDALTSFVYNVGPGGIGPDTGVGRKLRAGDYKGAADSMLLWDKAGGRVLAGLTRRRYAERAMFLSNPRAAYTKAELRWMREYDRRPSRARQLVLRLVMRRQARRISAAAKTGGWTASRRARYKSMMARS